MILGIDQGTTGTTAILLSDRGTLLGKYSTPVPQHFPQPGWVEHDPNEIWTSVQKAVVHVLKKTGKSAAHIQVIGITNQRETVSLFEKHRPLHRFIVWQDRRTADLCQKLKKHEKEIQKKTGLPLDPYFSGTKILWLLKKLKLSSKNKNIRFRTIDSFLLSKLTGADGLEATNASRTSLCNLKVATWDQSLFNLFGIPITWAPEVLPSEGFCFKTKNVPFLPNGIPVRAALGDQQAALFGQLGWKEGSGKITFGTGSFLLLNTGSKLIYSKNSLVSTLALKWSSGKLLYALEGSAFICGAWIQWLRDQLQILKTSKQSETLAEAVSDSGGVVVIPALSGMGAPFWKPHLRGAILGLTRGSKKEHVVRASLEALCFQNKALVEAMQKDSRQKQTLWKVDGGAVQNNLLMQMQSNALNLPLIRPKNLEATATGVAWLAAYSHGLLSLNDISSLWKKDREFHPRSKEVKKYYVPYSLWLKEIEG